MTQNISPVKGLSGRRIKELAMFGLRKAFIDPAPKPHHAKGGIESLFGGAGMAMDHWVPE